VITGGLLLVAQARVHVFIPGMEALRPGLLLMVAGAAVWLFRSDPLGRLGRPLPLGVKLALFTLFWAAVGVPFALWSGQSFRGVTGAFGTTILVFVLIVASARHLVDIRRLLLFSAVGGAIFGFVGPIQGMVPIRGFGAGGYDPNDSAMYLVSALPILVFFAVSSRKLSGKVVAGLAAFAALVAIVATQSRGGFLGLAAVLIFMLLFFRGIRLGTKILVVGVFCIGLAFTADATYWERMESIAEFDDGYGTDEGPGGRIEIWKRGMGYMFENPVTGVGLFNFMVAEGQSEVIAERIRRGIGTKYSAAHSMWVQVGAELGIPGFLAFVGLFGHVGWGLWGISKRRSRLRAERETSLMASALLMSLVGVAVAGSFLSNAYWSMVWAPLAIGVALMRLDAVNRAALRSEAIAYRSSPARASASLPYHVAASVRR
jgi:O-antigen ligase